MATEDFTQHPIVWVIIVLIFAGIFGSIGFLILGEVDEVVVESGVIQESSDCIVYNVTEIGEESLDDPDCGLDSSDLVKTIFFNEVNEYNCTTDPWASIERTEENCTCGCDNALYRVLVSWWDWEEIEEDWEDPCTVYVDYQWFGPPEEEYTCDCGCDSDEEIWIEPIGVYDINMTDPNPENWTYEYNYTICYADDYLGIMMDYYEDEENGTFVITTACNVSQFYNVTEPCTYYNVTDDDWNLSQLCTETEDCGCTEDDDWFGSWSYEWDITYCTDWNATNCSCDGEYVNETVCADSEYTWYEYEYDDPCEAVYNLTILTACNGLEQEWEWVNEVYCYNETNWDPKWPPWNYTSDLWFSSSCIEENSTVIAYDDYTNESDTYTFSSYYESTWSQSYSDVVGGIGGGFSLYSLIPLMTIISIVIGLLVSAFYFKKND